jgi:hypothetical protein
VEVVGTPDETDVVDVLVVLGGAGDGVLEQPATSVTAASTTILRRCTTSPACLRAKTTRSSYMVKLTFTAPNREGRGTQQ